MRIVVDQHSTAREPISPREAMRWAHTASEAHPLLLQVDIDVGESLQQVRDVLTRIAAADGSWLSLRVVDESRVMIWAQRRTDAADRVRKAMDQPGGI